MLGGARRSSCRPPHAPIQQSTWKIVSTNFAPRGFSELRAGPLRVSPGPDPGSCMARGPSQMTECGAGALGIEVEAQSGTS